nr:MAG TPA: hypothetical protein [Caudoviricetes sp.]
MIFTIISTFSLLVDSYVFRFYGTNTEQIIS